MLGHSSQNNSIELPYINILLVELDQSSALKNKEEILTNSFSNVTVRIVGDTSSALQYINGGYRVAEQKQPNIVLLDNELPDNSSLKLLTDIKANSNIEEIIVVMLTPSTDIISSRNSNDIADGYINKPINSQELVDLLADL